MAWPTANDYFEAMQHPPRRFCRPELKRGQVVLNADGKPLVRSGKRVDVYELRGADGHQRWAIGCFLHEPSGLARRFALINDHLQQNPLPALVDTEYHEQGICVRGRWYPITRSHWVEGRSLRSYVREFLDFPNELRLLADAWVQLGQTLRQTEIAHCNLASDTVLVVPGNGGGLTLRLVDYDALFVPALAELPPEEMGHPDFQHPGRDWQRLYNADADRFSQLAVLAALSALAIEGRALWERFDNGGNLLFRQSDFQEPGQSALFRELWRSESRTVRALVAHLIVACSASAGEAPALELAAEYLQPGANRSALSDSLTARVNELLGIGGESPPIVDDFVLEVEDEPAPSAVVAAPVSECAKPLPPPLPTPVPPPLPPAAVILPHMQTFHFDAWMPEQIAVVKLQGFVKDAGGEVVSSQPGHIRVHLLDDGEPSSPAPAGFLSWLGVSQAGPPGPRVLAVMELDLVHKPTPKRQLITITLRMSPGQEADVSPAWPTYCDHIFCNLRGYMMGSF